MRTKGKIATWHDDKGYGFVIPFDGSKQIFIHARAFNNRSRRPTLNDVVTYTVSEDEQGRPCAENATLAGDKLRKKAARRPSTTGIGFALAFLAGVGVAVMMGRLPAIVLFGYAAASLVAFVAYASDKAAAQRGTWRTPENTLLVIGLVGGWPGALIARQLLRHKSKKTSFRVQFWFTVVVNCAVFAWLFTSSGLAMLESLLA